MARVSLQTLLDRSDRNMKPGTHSVVRKSGLKMIELAYKEGIEVQISTGYRSGAEQNRLYAQGRTSPGNRVTNARAGQSKHNYGIAIDFFLTTKDGTKATWFVNNKWQRAAQIGISLGFVWGGNWTIAKDGIVDAPHLEMSGGLSTAQLRAGLRPTLRMKTGIKVPKPSNRPIKKPTATVKWKTKDFNWTGQTLKRGHKGKAVGQLQKKLADNYFYPNKNGKNYGIDEYYGADTESAVYRYQSVKGLAHDGIAGKEVYRSLGGKKTPTKKKPAEISVSKNLPNGVLERGDKGNKVKQLQRALNKIHFKVGKVDGRFGRKTEDAVKRVQYMYEHSAKYRDGKYGPRTKGYIKNLL